MDSRGHADIGTVSQVQLVGPIAVGIDETAEVEIVEGLMFVGETQQQFIVGID